MKVNNAHAVYAMSVDATGEGMSFRVGLPVDWNTAQSRWQRLDVRRRHQGLRVRFARRWYTVTHLEVRATDRHGRGYGSERHTLAFPVPYRTARQHA